MSEAIALSSPAVASGHRRDDRLVASWLLAVAAMIFIMVVIGGITRLTESGLSITEWKPLSGVIPPLDAAAWQREFDQYKTIPEFQKKSRFMRITSAGLRESHVHDVTITRESPNYPGGA